MRPFYSVFELADRLAPEAMWEQTVLLLTWEFSESGSINILLQQAGDGQAGVGDGEMLGVLFGEDSLHFSR